jgi:hypothetical protein
MMRVRLPLSMGGLPAFFLGLSIDLHEVFSRLFGRKTKLRRFFTPLSVCPSRAGGQRQGGFRGTRKHNLQLTKQEGVSRGFWLLTGGLLLRLP